MTSDWKSPEPPDVAGGSSIKHTAPQPELSALVYAVGEQEVGQEVGLRAAGNMWCDEVESGAIVHRQTTKHSDSLSEW